MRRVLVRATGRREAADGSRVWRAGRPTPPVMCRAPARSPTAAPWWCSTARRWSRRLPPPAARCGSATGRSPSSCSRRRSAAQALAGRAPRAGQGRGSARAADQPRARAGGGQHGRRASARGGAAGRAAHGRRCGADRAQRQRRSRRHVAVDAADSVWKRKLDGRARCRREWRCGRAHARAGSHCGRRGAGSRRAGRGRFHAERLRRRQPFARRHSRAEAREPRGDQRHHGHVQRARAWWGGSRGSRAGQLGRGSRAPAPRTGNFSTRTGRRARSSPPVRHLPNLICLLRIALVWPVAHALVEANYGLALVLFVDRCGV